MRKKVLVAMSGGVDSSVAAYLLKKKGYDVTGVTMCLGVKEKNIRRPTCCGTEAIDDAKKVCTKLGISHHVLDFSKHLENNVIEKFVSEYLTGRTPNPCVDCNKHLKFDILLKKAKSMNFDFLATGHYAKIEKKGKSFTLKKAKDKKKDQSYFLYPIKKENLKSILFPLGDLTKKEVRDIAKKENLSVADKKQSQDICFIPTRDYHTFLEGRTSGIPKGPIMTLEGDVLGEHKGAVFFTIGQRNGMGVGYKHPLYVVAKDATKNALLVGKKEDLKSRGLMASDVNLLIDNIPEKVTAKIRYNQGEASCKTILRDKGRVFEIIFDEPQEAITPGQSAVLYDGEVVLGGGVIDKTIGGK